MLQAQDIAAFRGERLVLRDVSLTVPLGGAVVLTGANGSGKSTLLRVLAGLIRPVGGAVSWNGGPVDGNVAYLGHADGVKPGLTVAENLSVWGSASPGLDAFGLGDLADIPGRMLSAGQKRRVALARLLVVRKPIWLLDEPTVALDSGSVDALGREMQRHRFQGGVVVAATHLALPLVDAGFLELQPLEQTDDEEPA